MKSKNNSELKVVQTMLEALNLEGVVFTMDALHCQKTIQLIIEGGNDHVITVKGNQPQLLTQLKDKAEHQKPCPRFVDVEKTRGRITCQIVQIFTELKNIDLDWVGVIALFKSNTLASAIGLQYLQTNHYISSLVSKATTFADGIRYSLGNWEPRFIGAECRRGKFPHCPFLLLKM